MNKTKIEHFQLFCPKCQLSFYSPIYKFFKIRQVDCPTCLTTVLTEEKRHETLEVDGS